MVGCVTYTSWDNYITKTSYLLDEASPPLLWRKTEIGQDKLNVQGEACISLETALGQLEAYQTKFADKVQGDDCAALAQKLSAAQPTDPKTLIAEEKAAEAAAAAEADY